jgi:zinc/manganese transport system substrate-binding protein
MGGRRGTAVAVGIVSLVAMAAGACSVSPGRTTRAGDVSDATTHRVVIEVVAAEDFWGSIAAQVGGTRVHVVSVITNPDTDPHDYEPTPADARAIAEARLVIENGVGYDPWVPRLLAADDGGQTVLDVGTLLRLPSGANPHRWYNPEDVHRVITALGRDLRHLDPSGASAIVASEARFETVGLASYHATIAAIRRRYAGTPVGASESIFAMLAPSLGLRLVTPPTFLKAISEGTDVSAADKREIDEQIGHHQISIYVENRQNVTPDVQTQLQEARAAHIPVTTITETLAPAGTTFQAWQTRQLRGIEAALHRATAR